MKIVATSSINTILHFAKLNHGHYCLVAHQGRDIKNFCRHFFFYAMDRKGRVRFDEPIVCVIEALTGWKKTSIRKAIAFLAECGEIMRVVDDDNAIIVNDLVANKQGLLVSFKMPYDGKNPRYDMEQLRLATALDKIVKHTEERSMYVTQQLSALKKENDALKLELAETKAEMRAGLREYARGVDKGFSLKNPVAEQQQEIETPAPSISIMKESNATVLELRSSMKH